MHAMYMGALCIQKKTPLKFHVDPFDHQELPASVGERLCRFLWSEPDEVQLQDRSMVDGRWSCLWFDTCNLNNLGLTYRCWNPSIFL